MMRTTIGSAGTTKKTIGAEVIVIARTTGIKATTKTGIMIAATAATAGVAGVGIGMTLVPVPGVEGAGT